jgi:hypothetical protein
MLPLFYCDELLGPESDRAAPLIPARVVQQSIESRLG